MRCETVTDHHQTRYVRPIVSVTFFFFFFFYLNHLQVRLCFLSSDIFAVAEVCLDPSVGVDECVGVALQMSILISWLDGLTDC